MLRIMIVLLLLTLFIPYFLYGTTAVSAIYASLCFPFLLPLCFFVYTCPAVRLWRPARTSFGAWPGVLLLLCHSVDCTHRVRLAHTCADYRFFNGGICVRVCFHFAYFEASRGWDSDAITTTPFIMQR